MRSRALGTQASYERMTPARSAERSGGYFSTTRPITEASGTSSPSRYHHLASQLWHVLKARSRPPTVIEILMRSPAWQLGQVPLLMLSHRFGEGFANIARHAHFLEPYKWLFPWPPPVRTMPHPGDNDVAPMGPASAEGWSDLRRQG